MPKNIINYENTIMYKIVCNDITINDLYVGQTRDFTNRKYLHKKACNKQYSNSYNLKIYKFIRDNGGWDNWSMVEIERFKCKDLNEATVRERYWFESLKATLNTQTPSQTKNEYQKLNKDKINKQKKEYLLLNKDKRKEYWEANKEKWQQYRLLNKEKRAAQHKQYVILNRDRINAKRHELYLRNKEKNKVKIEILPELIQ